MGVVFMESIIINEKSWWSYEIQSHWMNRIYSGVKKNRKSLKSLYYTKEYLYNVAIGILWQCGLAFKLNQSKDWNLKVGGSKMTIYEIISLAINLAILIIELLKSLPRKKNQE